MKKDKPKVKPPYVLATLKYSTRCYRLVRTFSSYATEILGEPDAMGVRHWNYCDIPPDIMCRWFAFILESGEEDPRIIGAKETVLRRY